MGVEEELAFGTDIEEVVEAAEAEEVGDVDDVASVVEAGLGEVVEELAAALLEPPESSAPPGARGNWAKENLELEV